MMKIVEAASGSFVIFPNIQLFSRISQWKCNYISEYTFFFKNSQRKYSLKKDILNFQQCQQRCFRRKCFMGIGFIKKQLKNKVYICSNNTLQVPILFTCYCLFIHFYMMEAPYIKTSPMICRANQLTGFYMIGTSVMT